MINSFNFSDHLYYISRSILGVRQTTIRCAHPTHLIEYKLFHCFHTGIQLGLITITNLPCWKCFIASLCFGEMEKNQTQYHQLFVTFGALCLLFWKKFIPFVLRVLCLKIILSVIGVCNMTINELLPSLRLLIVLYLLSAPLLGRCFFYDRLYGLLVKYHHLLMTDDHILIYTELVLTWVIIPN